MRDCADTMIRVSKAVALISAIFAVSTAAYAFQEQNSAPPAPAGPPAAAIADAPQVASPGESGTEIRIPGLGRLGVLPKMDFGLELLYGAADSKRSADDVPATGLAPNDDMSVRGTLKHNF